MKKTLLVLQGQFNNETLTCARTFKKLDLDILLIVWQNNEIEFIKDEFNIEKINDPLSLRTKDNQNYINTNRQITAMKFVLEKYSSNYDFIIKIRSDIFLKNSYKFKKSLEKAFLTGKIWSIGNQTASPRLFSPLLLENHISDWFFAGSPNLLKRNLQLDLIDENDLILNKPKFKKKFIFWRRASNEQVIWRNAWQKVRNKERLKLKIRKIGVKPSFHKCIKYARYLSDNFYISNFRDIGLQSLKYPINPLTYYRNKYFIFHIGRFESFLINKKLIWISVFYFPFIRFLIFCIFSINTKSKIRF